MAATRPPVIDCAGSFRVAEPTKLTIAFPDCLRLKRFTRFAALEKISAGIFCGRIFRIFDVAD